MSNYSTRSFPIKAALVVLGILILFWIYWPVEQSRPESKSESVEQAYDIESTPESQPLPEEENETVQFDPRWPTTANETLLAIPEEHRWYNAWSQVGSYGTIVGPVAGYYRAHNSPGSPIFINIGNNYPDSNRAQIVIWEERIPELESILSRVDDEGAWVSFSGYISEYNGVPQIDANDAVGECGVWTHVK